MDDFLRTSDRCAFCARARARERMQVHLRFHGLLAHGLRGGYRPEAGVAEPAMLAPPGRLGRPWLPRPLSPSLAALTPEGALSLHPATPGTPEPRRKCVLGGKRRETRNCSGTGRQRACQLHCPSRSSMGNGTCERRLSASSSMTSGASDTDQRTRAAEAFSGEIGREAAPRAMQHLGSVCS